MPTITREEFLNEYQSPYKSWASQADATNIKTPSDARIVGGWVVEQPLHTYFNWHMNRTDTRLAALEAEIAWLRKCLGRQVTSYSDS